MQSSISSSLTSSVVFLAGALAACGGFDPAGGAGDTGVRRDAMTEIGRPADAANADPRALDVPAASDTPAVIDVRYTSDVPMSVDARHVDAQMARDAPRVTDVPVVAPDGGSPDDPNTRTRSAMCTRWLADRPPRVTPTWTMGATICDPGTLNTGAHDDAVRILNVYRWLSGAAAVGTAPAFAAQQQACAIMMDTNLMLSHAPPSSWMCYSAAGASVALSSALALGATGHPASSVPMFIDERGSQLGHRRFCLYPSLGPTWFGATSRATCMQVFQRATGSLPRLEFLAYPNPGFAPIENTQGVWSIQPGSRSVAGGTVAIVDTTTGISMPTTPFDAGSTYAGGVALGWTLAGWTPLADHTYRVTITYPSAPMIQYNVTPTGCP